MGSRRKLVFLIDYCLAGEIGSYLRRLKKVKVLEFDAVGLTQNADDNRVVDVATKNDAVVLTGDKRFTERYRVLCTHGGIVKFEVKAQGRVRCLKRFMNMEVRHEIPKAVTRIYDDKVQIRAHAGTVKEVLYP